MTRPVACSGFVPKLMPRRTERPHLVKMGTLCQSLRRTRRIGSIGGTTILQEWSQLEQNSTFQVIPKEKVPQASISSALVGSSNASPSPMAGLATRHQIVSGHHCIHLLYNRMTLRPSFLTAERIIVYLYMLSHPRLSRCRVFNKIPCPRTTYSRGLP